MSSNSPPTTQRVVRPPSTITLIVAGIFVAANLIVPVVWGEVFPFTCAPMFCETPQHYCNYRVFGPDGQELSAVEGKCERFYNGNPLGMGVGIVPPRSIDQFGVAHDDVKVREHAEHLLSLHPEWPSVEIEQEVITTLPDGSVGRERIDRWKFDRGVLPP